MLLDSNIFLEVELAENHTNACKKLLRKVRDCVIKAAITDFHIDSILVVMEHYSESWKDLAIFLASSRKLSVLDVVLASYYLSSPLQSFPYHLLVQAGIIVPYYLLWRKPCCEELYHIAD